MRAAAMLVLLLVACQSAATPGDSCARASDCSAPLTCSRGRCRVACVRSDDCPPLARCLVDPTTNVATCSLDVDACATHGCARGFVCQGGRCLNACGSIAQCPDGVCADGACITVRGDAGVVPSDAGPPSPRITAIAGGNTHFCAVGVDPSTGASGLWCWGSSASRELGDRQVAHGACPNCSTTPVRAVDAQGAPLVQVSGVAAGSAAVLVGQGVYTCAIVGGGVQCWGAFGQSGGPVFTVDPQPVIDATSSMPLADVRELRGAMLHQCARVGPSRDVYCWGGGSSGQLGTGMLAPAMAAVRATQMPSTAIALDLGWLHTFALMPDGTMLGVGDNSGFSFGATAATPAATAVMSTEPPARLLASGRAMACFVPMSDGDVHCFGWLGPLVAGGVMDMPCPNGTCSLVPSVYAAPTGETIAGLAIAQGDPASTLCVWTTSGHAYCVGSSALALSTTTLAAVPNLADVAEIAPANDAMCARTNAGAVWCWGVGNQGELGRGTFGAILGDPTPQPVVW